jgi:hypothetical protein
LESTPHRAAATYQRVDVQVVIRPAKWLFAHSWGLQSSSTSVSDRKVLLSLIFEQHACRLASFMDTIDPGTFIVQFRDIESARKALTLYGACVGNTALAVFVAPLAPDFKPDGIRYSFEQTAPF